MLSYTNMMLITHDSTGEYIKNGLLAALIQDDKTVAFTSKALTPVDQ